ncbi:MFS general substrate transporter [Cryphonectria parasitica EP155]|uniref:MFS general substrate transporter n=1 Tax=Cryphonectria parasitica (strain ATCC 38755 / EP155) TaxID=660469 RepID=A0A9P4Y2Y3_CRYP1|nr:MFS general substrate transporter [Cryphonectria parasitica EP155]KAF3765596.1 MFS general substrate transporter [Cryphonectria parasitica EP155]
MNDISPPVEKVEKPEHVESRIDPRYDLTVLSVEDAEFLASFSEQDRKRVIRKARLNQLVPILTFLYLVSFTDRSNIGNAEIEGLNEDLGLDGVKYNIALCLFFVPYILCEIPSNWVLAKVKRPSYFLGTMIFLWGIVMTLTGIVQNFAGLVITRIIMGFLEAGFFPGAVYLISAWYLPNETQTRIAIFYCASAASGAFSGLLAFAIANMNGVGGYSAWRWIFIIEGAASVVCCLLAFLVMPDSPRRSSSFLTSDEIRYLEVRQLAIPGRRRHAQQESGEKFQWRTLLAVLADWQTYPLAIVYLSATGPSYALKFTMPQIIKNMGYQASMAQVLTIPPYTCGVLATIASSWVADRITWRMPFAVGADLLILIAHAILYNFGPTQAEHIPACYFALCLACMGIYPIPPTVNAWLISNTAPQTKRAMAIGYFVGLGNIGGIFGSFIYRQSEAPKYPSGYATAFSLASAGVILALVLEFTYKRLNERRAQLSEQEVRARYSEDQLEKMGDRSPLFRYSY